MSEAGVERIQVAAGIIIDAQRRVLIARRPFDKHQGGLWEFPGGKVEPHEPPEAALARELAEELGIEMEAAQFFTQLEFDYPDKLIALTFWRVEHFSGEPQSREGQALAWVPAAELRDYVFPPANEPVVKQLVAALAG